MAFGQSVRISASIPGVMPQATVIKRRSANSTLSDEATPRSALGREKVGIPGAVNT